jgi:hypothetical protein
LQEKKPKGTVQLPNFRKPTLKEFDKHPCHIIYSTRTIYIIVSGVIYGKFINKEMHDLYTSVKITRLELIELKRMKKNKFRKNIRRRTSCYIEDLDTLRIVSWIKPRMKRLLGRVKRMGEIAHTKFWPET